VNDDLVIRIRNNDTKAFAELVDTFGTKVLNLCISFTKNLEDAEDLTQEVFTKVYQSIHDFKGNASLATWIYRITVNQCCENLRKNKRLKRSGQNVQIEVANQNVTFDASSNPEEVFVNLEYRKILFSAFDRLPDNQRIAFTMQHFEGFTYKEIAEIMELSHAAVESLIFRARRHLIKDLKTVYQNYYS
jgi:RNA polymerase sigma-70 factor (ECF subfamily)